jgi:hypothetical protein
MRPIIASRRRHKMLAARVVSRRYIYRQQALLPIPCKKNAARSRPELKRVQLNYAMVNGDQGLHRLQASVENLDDFRELYLTSGETTRFFLAVDRRTPSLRHLNGT